MDDPRRQWLGQYLPEAEALEATAAIAQAVDQVIDMQN